MTANEVATLLRSTSEEVEQLAGRGEVPGRNLGASGWRFSREAIIGWLAGKPKGTDKSESIGQPTSGVEKDLKTQASVGNSRTFPASGPSRTETPTAEETALRNVALVGKPGTYTLDTRLAYTFSDVGSGSLANLGGRAESDTLNLGFGLSYRSSEKSQWFLNLPFNAQRNSREDVVAGEVIKTSSARLQPVGFGIKRSLVEETESTPQIIGGIDLQISRQPEVRHRIGLELSAKKELDPIVLFASVRGERAFGGTPDLGGHRIATTLGYVFAANDRMAVSTALTSRVEVVGDSAGLGWRRAKRFDLKLGVPISMGTSGLFMEPFVSFGLNASNSSSTVGIAIVKTLGR